MNPSPVTASSLQTGTPISILPAGGKRLAAAMELKSSALSIDIPAVAALDASSTPGKAGHCFSQNLPNWIRKTSIGGLLSLRYAVDWMKMLGGLCLWSLIFVPLPKALSTRIEKISAHRFLTGPKEKPDLKFLKDTSLRALVQERYIDMKQVLEENRESLAKAGLKLDEALDKLKIHAWHIPAPPGRPTVVLHHGRGSNLMHLEHVMQVFRQKKLGMLLYDYPGFGRSGGIATPDALNKSGVAVSLYAKSSRGLDIPLSQQIHVGNSLGSMVGAHTAHVLEQMDDNPMKALVLVNPLPSFKQVFVHMRDRFKLGWLLNENRIQVDMDGATPLRHLTRTPVHFVRGRNDKYIPLRQVQQMFEGVGSLTSSEFYKNSAQKTLNVWEDTRHRLGERDYQHLAQSVEEVAVGTPRGADNC